MSYEFEFEHGGRVSECLSQYIKNRLQSSIRFIKINLFFGINCVFIHLETFDGVFWKIYCIFGLIFVVCFWYRLLKMEDRDDTKNDVSETSGDGNINISVEEGLQYNSENNRSENNAHRNTLDEATNTMSDAALVATSPDVNISIDDVLDTENKDNSDYIIGRFTLAGDESDLIYVESTKRCDDGKKDDYYAKPDVDSKTDADVKTDLQSDAKLGCNSCEPVRDKDLNKYCVEENGKEEDLEPNNNLEEGCNSCVQDLYDGEYDTKLGGTYSSKYDEDTRKIGEYMRKIGENNFGEYFKEMQKTGQNMCISREDNFYKHGENNFCKDILNINSNTQEKSYESCDKVSNRNENTVVEGTSLTNPNEDEKTKPSTKNNNIQNNCSKNISNGKKNSYESCDKLSEKNSYESCDKLSNNKSKLSEGGISLISPKEVDERTKPSSEDIFPNISFTNEGGNSLTSPKEVD